MKVGLYLRVSTQEQAKEGYSIGEQEVRLRDYSKAMRWDIHKVYVDPGYSGADTNRPALQDLISDVENGKINKVIVYKLDRLSRSQLDTLFLIEKVFLANGCDFVSMTENFDTSTPFGRAMIGILAVFAQLEREKITERMIMGKEARAKEGKWNGGRAPIGYEHDKVADKLILNEYEAMQVAELFDLFVSGNHNLRDIERIFLEKGYRHKYGAWDPKSMRRILRSKLYTGKLFYQGKWYQSDHTAFVDEETQNEVVKILDARAEAFKLTGIKPGVQTSFLGGLLYCKHCGGKYTKQRGGTRKDGYIPWYYVCYSRNKKVKKMIKDPNCKNKGWRMQELDNIVFNEIRKLATNPEKMAEIQEKRKDRREEPNRKDIILTEIKKIDAQISRFMDLYGTGAFTIEQVSAKVEPLNEQKQRLLKELKKINSEVGAISIEEAYKYILDFEDVLEEGDFKNIRELIESLIFSVELDNDIVTINWKFA
jgi:site-specific DNA recombinase